MGGNQSRRERRPNQSQSSPSGPPPAQQAPAPAKPPAKAVSNPKPDRKYDVVVIATSTDANLTQYIQRKLEILNYSVFANLEGSDEKNMILNQSLVDCKVIVFVSSSSSAKCSSCGDQISLAYVYNKPIVIATNGAKASLLTEMPFGMRITMEGPDWHVFDDESKFDGAFENLRSEVEKISPHSDQPTATVPEPQAFTPFGGQDTDAAEGPSFWVQKFGEASEVSWPEFKTALIESISLEENMRPIVINTVHDEMFAGADVITADNFKAVCPPGKDFGKIAIRTAMERWTIQEVFSMESTVRLTSIENLSKIKSPAVVEALVKLLESDDPNIRAVAAISLGRAEKADEASIDRLLALLEDKDRIVRQSACLSLGRLKVTRAVPKISHIWRNDFISTVREAAHAALGQIGGPEAEQVLRVTDILQKEIAYLATSS
jgi:hypothetical protein